MTFPGARTLLAVVAGFVGVVLFVLGLASLGVYVHTVLEVMDAADRSPIFWYLVFVVIGLILVVVGSYFLVLGVWTYRNPETSLTLVGGSLVVLLLAATGIAGYVVIEQKSTEQRRRRRAHRQALREELERSMHRLEGLEVARLGDDGFTVELSVSGRRAGPYRLTLVVSEAHTEFLRKTEVLELAAGDTTLRRRIAYRDLFRTCDTVADSSRVPVCVDGTGARSFFAVTARLTLKDAALSGDPVNVGPGWNRSSKRTELTLDTFTEDGTVTVREARREP